MAKPLITDALWERIHPLLPPRPEPKPPDRPGRPPIEDRKALTGILFVLKTGLNWEALPVELGCGSGLTFERRLRDCPVPGVWAALHEHPPAALHRARQ